MITNSNVFGSSSNEQQTNASPAFGIDLGTTNSCISILRKGTIPEVIHMRDGSATLPSCVMYTKKGGEIIVGKEAYKNRHLPNVVYSAKRLIGSGETTEVTAEGETWRVSPIEVSAEILKELVRQISDRYKEVKDVVITVPADFNVRQVDDTIEAAKLAGLNVLSIFREPTAASLAFNLEDKINGDILVYDLGGGTFDASIVSMTNPNEQEDDDFSIYGFDDSDDSEKEETKYVVKSTRGDSHLGGDDFDLKMYEIFCRKLSDQSINTNLIPKDEKEKIILRLENLKKQSVLNTYEAYADFYTTGKRKLHVDTTVTLTPDDFFEATRFVFDKSKKLLDDLLKGYNGKLGAIVLVGGSTKNPFIKKLLENFYNVRVYDELNPDESVAMGAAIQANNLKFKDSKITVLDVISNGIGVYADNRIVNLIPRDQMVPCSVSKLFSTTVDNQEMINVAVYSGNSTVPENCVSLGALELKNTKMGPAGTVGVVVKLSIDSNGSLQCSADVDGNFKEVTLKNVFGTKAVKSTKKEKQCSRWRAYAEKLDETKKAKLLNLVELYEVDNISEEEVIECVREFKQETMSHTSSFQALTARE